MNRSSGSLALLLLLLSCSDPADDGDGGDDSGSGGEAGSGGSANPGGSGGTNAAGSSGAGTGGSTAGSGGSSTLCNDLPGDAPEYPQLYSPEPAPAGKGGTIEDGTYFVTSSTWYEAPEDLPEVMLDGIRMQIAAPYWNEVDSYPPENGVNYDEHYTHYVTTEANTLVTTQLCPSHIPSESFEYTAEGDSVTVYVGDGVTTFGLVLTRQ